jgi:hypothetical protein
MQQLWMNTYPATCVPADNFLRQIGGQTGLPQALPLAFASSCAKFMNNRLFMAA